MPDDTELLKVGVEGAVAGAMEGTGFKELVQQFLGPLAKEAGTGLGYFGTVFRIKIGLAMMEKATKLLADAGLEPKGVARKLFFPILDYGSLEDDSELQDRWASLLANA